MYKNLLRNGAVYLTLAGVGAAPQLVEPGTQAETVLNEIKTEEAIYVEHKGDAYGVESKYQVDGNILYVVDMDGTGKIVPSSEVKERVLTTVTFEEDIDPLGLTVKAFYKITADLPTTEIKVPTPVPYKGKRVIANKRYELSDGSIYYTVTGDEGKELGYLSIEDVTAEEKDLAKYEELVTGKKPEAKKPEAKKPESSEAGGAKPESKPVGSESQVESKPVEEAMVEVGIKDFTPYNYELVQLKEGKNQEVLAPDLKSTITLNAQDSNKQTYDYVLRGQGEHEGVTYASIYKDGELQGYINKAKTEPKALPQENIVTPLTFTQVSNRYGVPVDKLQWLNPGEKDPNKSLAKHEIQLQERKNVMYVDELAKEGKLPDPAKTETHMITFEKKLQGS